jgi:hypothetical protein
MAFLLFFFTVDQKRGLYGDVSTKLCGCSDTADPITGCGLDGFGGHETDTKAVCQLLETSSQVYDYSINATEVTWFIDTLETTFPYSGVGIAGIQNVTDWDNIRTVASTVFTTLSQHRSSMGGVFGNGTAGISFRYDWRTMLAAIRAYLPPREDLVGPTWQSILSGSFSGQIASDPGLPYGQLNSIFRAVKARGQFH